MRRHVLFFPVAAMLAATGHPAAADDDMQNPETVVVTATRTPEPRELTGASISVITAQALSDRQILGLSDALAETPGATIVRNGGVGQPTSILLRGAEAGQTLLLVDGVRIEDPTATDGSAILGDVLVNNVYRIEVLRGPQSTLYGSDAIGGVVDVLTRRGAGKAVDFAGDAEGGSFGTYRLNASAYGSTAMLDYGGGLNFYHTNGISAADSRYGNTETDGYTNGGATANVRVHVNEAVSVDLRTYDIIARDDFDDNFISISTPPYFRVGDSAAFGTDKLFAGYAGVNVEMFDGRLSNRVAVISTGSQRTTYPAPGQADDFSARGSVERFEYEGILRPFSGNEFTFGAEYQAEQMTTHSIFDLSSRPSRGHDGISGYYGQWQSTLWRLLTLTGGVRYDRDDAFGGHVSGKIAGALALNDGTTVLRANYGDGFKAPSLYELYSEYSNPVAALGPETAQGWETGVDQFFFAGRVRAALTWFERDTQEQIEFFDCFGPTSPACDQRYVVGGYYYNIGRSRAKGLEAEASWVLGDTLSATLDYTSLTAIDLATGNDLARVPHVTADVRLTWRPDPRLALGGSVGYVGKRFDDDGDTVALASNTLVGLYGSFSLSPALQLYGRVENVFDVRYEPAFGYGAAGRAAYAGIRATY